MRFPERSSASSASRDGYTFSTLRVRNLRTASVSFETSDFFAIFAAYRIEKGRFAQ
jgi:hypothetical protein